MHPESAPTIQMSGDAPWNLSLSIEWLGADVLCRIGGGELHAGAIALAEWFEGRARARTLTARGHRETEIARFAARRLCTATERTVVCVAGIHFDDVTRSEIVDISAQARTLVERAAELLSAAGS